MKEFCKSQGVNIDLENPKTIQDKLAWLNIYDDNILKVQCSDKIRLRDYCKDVLGRDICVPIIKVYNHSSEINFKELPNQFVIKCNHGSGMNFIVDDKSQINEKLIKKSLDYWMSDDFAFRNGFEAHYHDIEHKIFAEKYMNDGHETLHDYKFWCFNGIPKMYTINDGNGHGDIMYYTMDGEELNLYQVTHHDDYIKPQTFDKMIEYAKKLAEPFKFVRVDFYEIDGKVYLGEMTFTPGALGFRYKNKEDNIKIGNLLEL